MQKNTTYSKKMIQTKNLGETYPSYLNKRKNMAFYKMLSKDVKENLTEQQGKVHTDWQ